MLSAAYYSPLPPTRTGVAHYSSILLPALQRALNLQVHAEPHGGRSTEHAFYQLGNNPHHEWIYAEAMRSPGVIVLHDLVLHHLIVEMTLARGDADGYVAALEASHGAAGAAWARGRANGLHSEMGNFLLPASVDVANRSRAVIVHNDYARRRLLSFGVTAPIHVVPHPYVRETRQFDRMGFSPEQRVIGFFGFLTSAKRAEVVLEAFRIARSRDPRLVLLIVGEPAPNIEVPTGEGIITTGYVADEDFPAYYAAADRLVNLRYPSAGETSGTLIRALDAGKPVAVSDYAQFAELPDDCVVKIPFGEGEIESLADFFTRDIPDPSRAQRAWLENNARVELTVDGYVRALQGGEARDEGVSSTLPLFPQLRVVSISSNAIALRNAGTETIRTRTYGAPEYRIIVQGRWLSLPRDLAPGEVAELRVELAEGECNLYHAIQGMPMLPPEPFACLTITR